MGGGPAPVQQLIRFPIGSPGRLDAAPAQQPRVESSSVSKSTVSKKFFSALAIAGALTLSLAACSGTASGTGINGASTSCTPTKSGTTSDSIKVAGAVKADPKATFKKGITAKATERTVIDAGSGAVAQDGNSVSIYYTAYNGATGASIDTTGYTKGNEVALALTESSLIPGLYKAIHCSAVGSRVAVVVPPADAFGTTGSEQLGLGASDSIVFVIDTLSVKSVLTKANGKAQAAKAGYPTVKLAADGTPTITIPKADPPTALMITDLKTGTGATVKDGDTVTVHYVGVLWKDGSVFDSSWARGEPASFATSGVIPGFTKALVGQKVGSQVIAVIPPADGYGSAGSGTTISGTDTLVFVIDILATS